MKAVLIVTLAACGGSKGEPFLDVGSASEKEKPSGSDEPKEIPKDPKEPKEVTTEWIPPVDGVSKSSPIIGDPTLNVVERAFRNQQPAFPLLSKDGTTAVVDMRTRHNPQGWLIYTVDYIGVGSTTPVERIPLVDESLMTIIGTAMDYSKIPMTNVKAITKAARKINDRVAEEFTAFEGHVDKLGVKATGTFKITQEDELVVKVTRDGWQAETPKQEAMPMPRVGSTDCVAHAVLRRVYFDNARRRVLVHIGWRTDSEKCSLPDDRYHLLGPT